MITIVACGGSVGTVPSTSDDAGGGGGGGDGAVGIPPLLDAATKPDGATLPDGSALVCKTDADCNGDPQVSSLEGSCFQGICICRSGLHVQPNGKCSKTLPTDCMSSAGKCVQNPATCPGGLSEGSQEVNMTCGDLVAAVCCFDPTTCIGPQFTCCAPNDAAHAAVCESGYRTCPADYSPVGPGGGCG